MKHPNAYYIIMIVMNFITIPITGFILLEKAWQEPVTVAGIFIVLACITVHLIDFYNALRR